MNPPNSRRGTIYLLVLGAALMVIALGIAAVSVARSRAASQRSAEDLRAARAAAISGIGSALSESRADLSWREIVDRDPLVISANLGRARLTVVATDPADGQLADAIDDPVEFEAIASVGDATQRIAARFNPVTRRPNALACALAAGGNLNISGATADILGTAASGRNISATNSTQTATAWRAAGSISGSGFSGAQSAGGAAPEFPTAEALTYLQSLATTISYASTGGVIQNALLTDSANPFGATSSKGVYLIDCAHSSLIIKKSRIHATLVILNPGAGSRVEDAVSIETASADLPALVVSGGSLEFRCSGADLAESKTGVNFNPLGSPYDGVADIDLLDSYANAITGVVWISGDLTIAGTAFACDGAVLAEGDITVGGAVFLRARTLSGAAPGFVIHDRWDLDANSVARRTK